MRVSSFLKLCDLALSGEDIEEKGRLGQVWFVGDKRLM